jgi:hypothetical protein
LAFNPLACLLRSSRLPLLLLNALAKRIHEIDDVGAAWLLGSLNVLTLLLFAKQLLQGVLVLVLEFLGLKPAALALDNMECQVEHAQRVTDKMPSNYYFAGLIHLALPNTKIIHTIRDPVDTCISCFSKLFSAEQNHTYDLSELGRYYKRYERLIAHWHHVLPAGCILDVRYEDVVADVEGQARRLIACCGLPWDDRCLAFHKTTHCKRDASAPADLQKRGRALARLRGVSRTFA